MTGNEQLTDALKKLEEVSNENEKLKKLLSAKYSTKKLLIVCITASIALGFNLASWYNRDLFLVHPALAIPLLIGAIGFGILAYWRIKKEKNKS